VVQSESEQTTINKAYAFADATYPEDNMINSQLVAFWRYLFFSEEEKGTDERAVVSVRVVAGAVGVAFFGRR
jgi:hypothetical protein